LKKRDHPYCLTRLHGFHQDLGNESVTHPAPAHRNPKKTKDNHENTNLGKSEKPNRFEFMDFLFQNALQAYGIKDYRITLGLIFYATKDSYSISLTKKFLGKIT